MVVVPAGRLLEATDGRHNAEDGRLKALRGCGEGGTSPAREDDKAPACLV